LRSGVEILAAPENTLNDVVSGVRTMKVRVQFYAQLRDLVGIRELEAELPQGATVRELLEEIYAQKPGLRAHDKRILIGAGLEFVDRDYNLKPGEEIAIMPPVQGG
jgi:molybdopterin converting factor small subunit